jgi:hypothetical protein
MENHWLVRTCLLLCAVCSTVTLVAHVALVEHTISIVEDAQHILQSLLASSVLVPYYTIV